MKFEALARHILEESVTVPELPYRDRGGHIAWRRKGGNLKGAPEVVEGYFDCSRCHLDSLEGAPRTVRGGFSCSTNDLLSLEGSPETVGESFWCNGNINLTSLKGAPETVGGVFYCGCCPLTSLEGIPEALSYEGLPEGFTEEDARKEVAHRRFAKGLDKETISTWEDFCTEL